MTDATSPDRITGPTPDTALRDAERQDGPMLAADGTPLKKSLARALRAEKIRALLMIAPLLVFVLITFIAPIGQMLFRSVENQIVQETLPLAVPAVAQWDAESGEAPGDEVFEPLFFDVFLAAEARAHTKLGGRLNYETAGISSLFRRSGRAMDDVGEPFQDALEDYNEAWEEAGTWYALMQGEGERNPRLLDSQRDRLFELTDNRFRGDIGFTPGAEISALLPLTAREYSAWALWTAIDEEDVVAEEEPWEAVYAALALDLIRADAAAIAAYDGPQATLLQQSAAEIDWPEVDFRAGFVEANDNWLDVEIWRTIQNYSPAFTSGYFLNAVGMQKGLDGPELRPENERYHMKLFWRTMFMSLVITGSCILLGYPVAWILANLPARSANLLLILVLLPFWTSLLVRTSAWKVMLQQQGVINDVLVWIELVADDGRLALINNQTGTIIAMTHILLPFMILPLYSVMKTIPPSYLRAAKSLGATNTTAFWRVYFPQSIPGIGAGSILVFILAIGYYITPAIVGGTTGIFISNQIAYHISSSLNWGLAAALGAILLVLVLVLYWCYDRMVGIDNVKLGG